MFSYHLFCNQDMFHLQALVPWWPGQKTRLWANIAPNKYGRQQQVVLNFIMIKKAWVLELLPYIACEMKLKMCMCFICRLANTTMFARTVPFWFGILAKNFFYLFSVWTEDHHNLLSYTGWSYMINSPEIDISRVQLRRIEIDTWISI